MQIGRGRGWGMRTTFPSNSLSRGKKCDFFFPPTLVGITDLAACKCPAQVGRGVCSGGSGRERSLSAFLGGEKWLNNSKKWSFLQRSDLGTQSRPWERSWGRKVVKTESCLFPARFYIQFFQLFSSLNKISQLSLRIIIIIKKAPRR